MGINDTSYKNTIYNVKKAMQYVFKLNNNYIFAHESNGRTIKCLDYYDTTFFKYLIYLVNVNVSLFWGK